MESSDCVQFLQWALPQMHMRWAGFRRVRRQVCKRILLRISDLRFENIIEYQNYVRTQSSEWAILDSFCRISISRFYRDKAVFDAFATHIFPYLCSLQSNEIRVCSLGCCSGEEPYTLQMIWKNLNQFEQNLVLFAVDNDAHLLHRAKTGQYQKSSMRDLPEHLYRFFESRAGVFQVNEEICKSVKFLRMDLRKKLPSGLFDLILCRNLVFTYYDEVMQRDILRRLYQKLSPAGLLIIGIHEQLPSDCGYFEHFNYLKGVFKRV